MTINRPWTNCATKVGSIRAIAECLGTIIHVYNHLYEPQEVKKKKKWTSNVINPKSRKQQHHSLCFITLSLSRSFEYERERESPASWSLDEIDRIHIYPHIILTVRGATSCREREASYYYSLLFRKYHAFPRVSTSSCQDAMNFSSRRRRYYYYYYSVCIVYIRLIIYCRHLSRPLFGRVLVRAYINPKNPCFLLCIYYYEMILFFENNSLRTHTSFLFRELILEQSIIFSPNHFQIVSCLVLRKTTQNKKGGLWEYLVHIFSLIKMITGPTGGAQNDDPHVPRTVSYSSIETF